MPSCAESIAGLFGLRAGRRHIPFGPAASRILHFNDAGAVTRGATGGRAQELRLRQQFLPPRAARGPFRGLRAKAGVRAPQVGEHRSIHAPGGEMSGAVAPRMRYKDAFGFCG
jgi:hypothetical protein